jgi:hypothetical protein
MATDITLGEYNGNNELSALATYYYRLLYSASFSSVGSSVRKVSKSITDFEFAERALYGRVNEEMIPIVPKEDHLVQIFSADATNAVRVMDFVALAFTKFQRAFQDAHETGQIRPDEGFMTYPEPKRGYTSPTTHYTEYRTALFEIFSQNIRNDKSRNMQIKDFDSFVPHFENFIENSTTKAPFTFSGFLRSNYANVLMTGLAIDLTDMMDASIDNKKVQRIYDNPNYPFYENMALQFGFRIDKNCPYRIIADLGSPAMQRHMTAMGYNSVQQALANCYEPAYLLGYNNFKSLFVIFYNSLIGFSSVIAQPNLNQDGTYSTRRVFRTQQDLIELNLEYGELWFLEKYAQIRNLEERGQKTAERMSQISKRAFRYGKIKGKERALYMISKQVATTAQEPGSFAQITKARDKQIRKSEKQAAQRQAQPGMMGGSTGSGNSSY